MGEHFVPDLFLDESCCCNFRALVSLPSNSIVFHLNGFSVSSPSCPNKSIRNPSVHRKSVTLSSISKLLGWVSLPTSGLSQAKFPAISSMKESDNPVNHCQRSVTKSDACASHKHLLSVTIIFIAVSERLLSARASQSHHNPSPCSATLFSCSSSSPPTCIIIT